MFKQYGHRSFVSYLPTSPTMTSSLPHQSESYRRLPGGQLHSDPTGTSAAAAAPGPHTGLEVCAPITAAPAVNLPEL